MAWFWSVLITAAAAHEDFQDEQDARELGSQSSLVQPIPGRGGGPKPRGGPKLKPFHKVLAEKSLNRMQKQKVNEERAVNSRRNPATLMQEVQVQKAKEPKAKKRDATIQEANIINDHTLDHY